MKELFIGIKSAELYVSGILSLPEDDPKVYHYSFEIQVPEFLELYHPETDDIAYILSENISVLIIEKPRLYLVMVGRNSGHFFVLKF